MKSRLSHTVSQKFWAALILIGLVHFHSPIALAASPTYYPSPYWNTDGETRTTHIFLGETPIATVEIVGTGTPKIFSNHSDHLTSTKVVTDENGEIAELAEYEPFGTVFSNASPTNHREQRKFTGHEFDPFTNYTYAKARYLDTEFGRFLSQDPAFVAIGDRQAVGEKTGRELEQILVDPQAMNSYAYARNNPIKFVDPTGEYIESALDVAFIAADIHALSTQGMSFLNVISLIGDMGGILLPGVTGVGTGIKIADKAIDGLKAIDKVDDVIDAGKAAVNGIDNISSGGLVCRGGACKAENFLKGSNEFKAGLNPSLETPLSGISVNVGDNLETLLQSGALPNYGQYGESTTGIIKNLGGSITPGGGPSPYHGNLNGLNASQLEKLFTPTKINPFKKK